MDRSELERLLSSCRDENRRRLMTLVATCEEMILLARKGDWERVAELEERRSAELKDYFSRPVSAEESQGVGEAMRLLVGMNETLVSLVSDARSEVAADARELSRARHASQQYLCNRL